MRKTAIYFFSVLILLCIISCSSEGVVDDAFTAAITFNGNGATSGDMAAQKVGRGSDTRLEANAFERTSYRFIGWNTASDGSGTAYTDRQSINTKENITLYAQWELDTVVLTSSTYPWTDGKAYILNSDVTIGSWVDVTGNVILILTDGNTLTASKGISVYDGAVLTIDAQGEGTGVLIATGSGGQAGIGGYESENCGTVIINGGVITASGGSGAAGIGGADNSNFGEITINGGIVTASGGQNSAGIGNGWNGSGGTVTINGGTVNATGNGGGAGIGGGEWGDGGERIIINDGNVTASGGTGAAGIGGGHNGDGGEITINGGNVTASGGTGAAGIGGGQQGDGGVITINGGTVTASGGTGAVGIGKGTGGTDDGKLNLGEGVSLVVRWSYIPFWSDYDGTNRMQYMNTVQ